MNIYLLYIISGSIGGFLGGLLGLGGGIVFVPALFFIFTMYGLNQDHIMQSAVSTSLACVVISSLSAAIKHNMNKCSNIKDLKEDKIVWTIVTGWRSGSSNNPISDDGLAILIDEIMTNL